MVGGEVKNSPIFSLGDGTIPGDGQVKQISLPSPDNFFPGGTTIVFATTQDHFFCVWGAWRPPKPPCFPEGLRPPDPPSLISLNMSLVGHVTWKCIPFSDLKTM